MIAAEYTAPTKRHTATLDITRISEGRRTILQTIPVQGRREARAVANEVGAKPWNF